MKRTKKLYILLGVLVVICIATFALSKTEEKKEKIKNSDKTILEVDRDSVNKISWKSSSGSLAFEKKDDTWVYTDDANFPVDQDKIAERLKLFKEFGVAFEIEDVDDYGQYGLDDPECTITLRRTMRLMKFHWVIIVPWILSVMFQSEMEMCTL